MYLCNEIFTTHDALAIGVLDEVQTGVEASKIRASSLAASLELQGNLGPRLVLQRIRIDAAWMMVEHHTHAEGVYVGGTLPRSVLTSHRPTVPSHVFPRLLSRLLTPYHLFSRLPTPYHLFSRLPTPSLDPGFKHRKRHAQSLSAFQKPDFEWQPVGFRPRTPLSGQRISRTFSNPWRCWNAAELEAEHARLQPESNALSNEAGAGESPAKCLQLGIDTKSGILSAVIGDVKTESSSSLLSLAQAFEELANALFSHTTLLVLHDSSLNGFTGSSGEDLRVFEQSIDR